MLHFQTILNTSLTFITLSKLSMVSYLLFLRQKLVLPYPQSVTFAIVSRCFEIKKKKKIWERKMPFVDKKWSTNPFLVTLWLRCPGNRRGQIRDVFAIFFYKQMSFFFHNNYCFYFQNIWIQWPM